MASPLTDAAVPAGISEHTLTEWPMPSVMDVPELEPEPPEDDCDPTPLLLAVVPIDDPQPASSAVATAADMRETRLAGGRVVTGVLLRGSVSLSGGHSRSRDRRPIAKAGGGSVLSGATASFQWPRFWSGGSRPRVTGGAGFSGCGRRLGESHVGLRGACLHSRSSSGSGWVGRV